MKKGARGGVFQAELFAQGAGGTAPPARASWPELLALERGARLGWLRWARHAGFSTRGRQIDGHDMGGATLIVSRAAQRISAGTTWEERPAISDTCGRPKLHGRGKIILPVVYE